MTDSLKFKRYYVALNPEQKRAVDTVEGPVFVVAGPGTGKTQVLTLRIANILRQTDTPPDGILALTFTNAGVAAMRERLVEIAGAAGYRVAINTFHGFCNELIGRFPERFPRIIGGAPVGKVERVRIMEKLIETLPLKRWRPAGAPFYYLQPLLAALDRWKKDNQPPKERELALIYRGYQKELARRQRYDFADMITEVVAVLKKETGFRRQLQEEYLYLLADEHQDANAAQNELLRLLADYHARPNLFIVGDEKQAIFQFQGASLENFNYFKKLYPDASLIRLTQNYRSGQPLLDGAHALMSRSGLPAEILTPLRSQAGASAEKIRVATLPNPVAEQQFLVSEIKARLAAGVAPGALAVIYRDNADGRPFQLALEAAGVPLNVRSETDLLADRTVAQLILVLETIHHFGADHYLKQFLHLDFLKLDSLAVYHLLAEPLPLYPRLKKAPGALGELFKKLERWHRLAHNQNLLELFGVVSEETGFLAFLLKAPAAAESLVKLQSFYEELKELALTKSNYDLADFMDYLATLRRHDLKLSVTAGAGQAGVALLTAHKAKGLEFDYVYLVGATESRWGERRSRAGGLDETSLETEPASEGERRLFYVALTRARRGITVSYAQATRDGRPQPPTRFIEEIDKNLVERLAPVIKTPPLQVLTARPPRAPKLAEKSYLNQLFRERGFSVTHLNNYLNCPRRYFYLNLLRLTQVEEGPLLYGTAIHQTLKDFFDDYKKEAEWPVKKLSARFKFYLAKLPLGTLDAKNYRLKGERALTGYFKEYHARWPRRIINEFSVRGVALGDGLTLNGQIDKLEIGPDGRSVCAVDYKTGRPKSRQHILGGLKAAGSGDYFRQLVFYKLLLDKFEAGEYRVEAGLLDFIEPDEKGRYHQEKFELTDAHVSDLKNQIKAVVAEILNLEFFRRGCEKPDCEFCRLYNLTNG